MNISEAISRAFSVHAGQTLTDDVIQKMTGFILWATQPEDKSHDPDSFPHGGYQGVTFQVERFSDCLEELKPLHEAQWLETDAYRHGQGLNPDYDGMIASERNGGYILFTARKDGVLIGNCGVYLFRSTHTQQLNASEDTLFILQDHRAGRLGIKLFQYCEAILYGLGVHEVRFKVKTGNRVWKAWQRLGYDITGIEMSKQLQNADIAYAMWVNQIERTDHVDNPIQP